MKRSTELTNPTFAALLAVAIVSSTLFSAGCESGPRPTQKPETSLIGEPPSEKPAVRQAKTEAEDAPPEEDVRVEMVMLEKGNPYETDTGVTVQLRSQSPVEIVMTSPEREERISLPEGATYGEGRAFGSTWSVSTDAGLHLHLRHDPPPPLTAEEARAIALRELDANLGCEGELREVASPPGTVRFVRVDEAGESVCSGTVGLFTREVLSLQESPK